MAAYEGAEAHTRELRRDLVAAQRQRAGALAAADPRLRTAEKAAARDAYQLACRAAQTDAEIREATAAWGSALDHVNRTSRLHQRAASSATAKVRDIEAALRAAERGERGAMIVAEQAESACLDARVLLAACEEEG